MESPKVTGLSPMTGPPGTKITVRGENLGESNNDIISLTINGADCLPYLEWKSPKKIITRCTKVFGNGDVVVTTNSGGVGTCDVQFNCHEEIVGPTDESAVWIDEIDYQAPEKDENFHISDTNDEYSMEVSSARYKPQKYLLRNHPDASLDDLERLKRDLQVRLANKSDTETMSSDSNRSVLLKSNLPVIMECLHILERLSKLIATSRDTSIDSITKSINEALFKTHELFDPLLKQNKMVQSIESSLEVFRRKDGSFFDMPVAINDCIEQKNYDSIVKEITNVMSRLKIVSIDQELKARIGSDLTKRVDMLRTSISEQLHESCRSTKGERNIDELKKLITHLNRLGGGPSFDAWIALDEMSNSLIKTLTEKFEQNLQASLFEARDLLKSKTVDIDKLNDRPDLHPLVEFVESSVRMFQGTYYDILALGQSYFDPKDEFACREEFRTERYAIFNEIMISNPITHLCSLLRLALISNLDDSKIDRTFWPDYEDQKDLYWNWMRYTINKDCLRHILNSVITCQIQLTKSSLTSSAAICLNDFKKFCIELRRQAMELLFKNAALTNKNLHHKEDWLAQVDDKFGSVTKLPSMFEANVIEVLVFAKETILKKCHPEEVPILKNVAIQAELKELAYGLINSFHTSLDNALSSSDEYPAELNLVLLASKNSTKIPTQLSNRLLITICNYQFTRSQVFPKLRSEFKRLLEINVEKVFEECSKKYRDYIDKAMNRFCAIKCKELISDRSDYLSSSKDFEASMSGSDLQINLMIANSQIFLVAPQLVDRLMPDIINKTLEERGKVRL